MFRTDAPWEGNGSGFQSGFQDGDRFRMYYRGGHHPASRIYETEKISWETLCLAESRDCIHWTRPELGIVEFRGSTRNNLILDEDIVREIGGRPSLSAVFKDANPECPPRERYKIVIMGKKPRGLYLLVSADGIHLRLRSPKPFTTTRRLRFTESHVLGFGPWGLPGVSPSFQPGGAAQSQRFGTTVTDAAFMTSRDGLSFNRWGEAFIRPGTPACS